jgi:hypothetical protein
MAELTPLFMDVSEVYSGDELALPYRDLVSEGIVTAGALAVTERGAGANLSVDVALGACWVLGDTNVDRQPCYRCFNDAVKNLGITPDPTNPRKVLVVAQITDEGFAGTGRKWELVALHGTPAGAPLEPALPASALPLALIDVTAADASIANAQITDRRVRARTGGQLATIRKGVPISLPAGLTNGVEWPDAALTSLFLWFAIPDDYVSGDLTWRLLRRGAAAGTAVMSKSSIRFRDNAAFTVIDAGVAINFTPGDVNSHMLAMTIPAAQVQAGDIVRFRSRGTARTAATTWRRPSASTALGSNIWAGRELPVPASDRTRPPAGRAARRFPPRRGSMRGPYARKSDRRVGLGLGVLR